MKNKIHPKYKKVVFFDQQTYKLNIINSTFSSKEKIKLEGKIYSLIKCEFTSQSHPFYIGKQGYRIETGRVEKFKSRFLNTYKNIKLKNN